MPKIFRIDKSFIKAVDDETARELVARLCRAELRAQGLPESSVTWGGDQRAKDGGVDVRVDCPSPLRTPDFLKTPRTVFQVKAERFPPSRIREEMAPQGTLRPAIIELKETTGTYIIVSTQDDHTDLALQPRRDAIRQCLIDYQLDTFVQSDFYDSRRIADWVEQHPSVAAWLRYRIGQPLKGWRPYGPWAYGEDDPEAEYLIDDRVRVFVPGVDDGRSITDTIAQLRRELERPVSIRIVGLSGVGKTRLVQAIFDPRVCPESLAPTSDNVIYVDLADEPEPQPQMMLESLFQCRSDSTVVVDNCGPDNHQRLTRLVKRQGSLLKLITVEYDIRDDLPENTLCYRLDGSSPEVIRKLLSARYRRLSESDVDRITEFSDGNARVAFALASSAETGGELSQLRDRELFERLFRQKNDPNDSLLRSAEAASLLYSFDGSDVSLNGEIARLASLVEVTPLAFFRYMSELERRGLLQKRGQWRAVLPHAIANGLARRMLQSAPEDLLYDGLIQNGGGRIARSFSRRLGFLHDCPQAVAMASRMFAVDGKLGDLSVISELEREMFANLAPLNPRGALDAIERALKKDDYLSTDSVSSARFAGIARSIAYEPDFFDDAVSILRRLALAEPEEDNHKPLRDMLRSLFSCHLSGTQARPEQRHKVAEELVSSRDDKERDLGLDLISAGLEALHFSADYGFEFGAKRRDYGWHPRSLADVKKWYRPWVDMVTSIGEQNDSTGRRARTILGEAWRGLWGRVGLDDELVDVARRLASIDGWPEGWLGVRQVLQWDAESLPPASLAQLRELEKRLAPSNAASEIRARILAPSRLSFDIEEDEPRESEDNEPLSGSEKYQRALLKAEMLGTTAASSPGLLEALLPDLCSTRPGIEVFAFGQGVGKYHAGMATLLDAVRTHIESASRGALSLIWVRGLLSGWKDKDPIAFEAFLDYALTDVVWREWFVELQVQAELGERSFARLVRALDQGLCPTGQFAYLAMGRATDPLTVAQIITLANKLALRPDRGLFTAIDLLAMVVHCTDKQDKQYKDDLGEALLDFLSCIDWSVLNVDHARVDHELGVILTFALQAARSESQVASILRRMLLVETDRVRYNDVRKNALKPFFQYFPRRALELVCTPGQDGKFRRAIELVSDSYSGPDETAVGPVPTEALITWCKEEPDTRFAFAASVCKLFDKQSRGKARSGTSETAIALLAAAPDKTTVVRKLLRRFRPTVWAGSLADILEARLPLLDELATCDDEAVRSEIAAAKARLQTWIDAERASEREEERSRNSSFE